MEDFDILNKFDNDKLIDVVKNYKRYGYDDEIRDHAIKLLVERGWNNALHHFHCINDCREYNPVYI